MTKKKVTKKLEVIEGIVVSDDPTPSQIKLAIIDDCRREMGRIYRDARLGRIDPQTGTRLTYILVSITNVIKDHEIEERVKKLEDDSEKLRKKN